MIRNIIFYILAALGLFLFYVFCDSYTPLAIIVIFLSLTLFSIGASFYVRRKITIEVEPIHRFITQSVNQRAEFCTVIRNDSYFTVPMLTFQLYFCDAADDGVLRRKIKTPLAPKEERRIHTMVSTSHSALISCSVIKPKIYDAFGLLPLRLKSCTDSCKMLISPVMPDESYIRQDISLETYESDKYSDTQKGDDCSQVFEVREYVPGDDVRRIHWRLSSKHDTLMVKEYSKPINNDCIILLESGIGNDDIEACKTAADSLLSVFSKLAYELVENEQMFSVCWYCGKVERIVSFDVKSYDDSAAVLERFLSEKYDKRFNISLIMAQETFLASQNKKAYYLYNSSASLDNIYSMADESMILIDTAEVTCQSAAKGEKLNETKRSVKKHS